MKQNKIKPTNSDYQSQFLAAKNHLSDMEFYQSEFRFFRFLINKYYMWLINEGYAKPTNQIQGELDETEKHAKIITKSIEDYLQSFKVNKEDFYAEDWAFKNDQGIENDLLAFNKDFQSAKRKVFGLIESVMESKKMGYLLNHYDLSLQQIKTQKK